jgi:hypothetical protein
MYWFWHNSITPIKNPANLIVIIIADIVELFIHRYKEYSMKAKAIIIIEKYTLKNNLNSLIKELIENEIQPVFLYDIQDLPSFIQTQDTNQPFLYFENQNMHFDIKAVKKFLLDEHKFTGLQDITNKLLGFYPRGIQSIRNYEIKLNQFYFIAKNIKKIYREPNVEYPHLVLYTWNRQTYFTLTLNSLIHSMPENVRPPLTIVLNEPSVDIVNIAWDSAKKYGPKADILVVKQNSKIAASQLALIWHKPKSFVCLEDDFILPNSTQIIYPNWPRMFAEKLEFFDVVGWCSSVDNYPYKSVPEDYYKGQFNVQNKRSKGELWVYNEPSLLMAQGLAISTDLYRSVAKHFQLVPNDIHMFQFAGRGKCCPTLLGYHIGWNQQQDGYGSLNSRRWGDFGWSGKYNVTNLMTKEERIICPKEDL